MSEMEDRIIKVAGTRKGTWIYLYKKRRYYFDAQKSKDKNIYRSAERRNGCQSVIYEYPDGTIEENGKIHMGLDDSGAFENDRLKRELAQAICAGRTLKDITNNLSQRYAHVKSKKAINMQARRAYPIVRVSSDLKVLAQSMKQYNIEGDTLLQEIISIESGDAIILHSPKMLHTLTSESRIIIDQVNNIFAHQRGTQIVTIHSVRAKGTLQSMYCIFVVYLSGPTQELYERILLYILTVAPLLKGVETVFTGTDNTMVNAVLAVLPEANRRIQWLDFVKSVGDIWRESVVENVPNQFLHYLWILGVSGEGNIESGLKFIGRHISEHIDKFPQLGSLFFLFKSRWEQRIQFLGTPLEALQLNRRADAIGRYLLHKFRNCSKNVQKLTGALYETLENERKLMEAFVNDTPCEVRDKTTCLIKYDDVKHFETVYKQYHSRRIELESFFNTCFYNKLLSRLRERVGIQRKTNMEFCELTNGVGLGNTVSTLNAKRKLNFTSLKRKLGGSTSGNTSLPSGSGIGEQQRIYEKDLDSDTSSESLSDDDEHCPWEFNGGTFQLKNPQQ